MELRDIRYFAVVAEKLNLSRAAEALDLSVPALSKSLRRLEASVGTKLVQRSQKGLSLTAVGRGLLNRIAPLQGMLRDVRHEAADLAAGSAGHVAIGSGLFSAEDLIADACSALAREAPAVTFEVWSHAHKQLTQSLRKGEIDFYVAGLQEFSPEEFKRIPLLDDAFCIYASSSHRLAQRQRVTLDDLASERWALTNVSSIQWQLLCRAMESRGLTPPRVALHTNSPEARLAAIAHGGMLGLSSRRYMQKARGYDLMELRVPEMTHVRHLSIVHRKDAYLSPAAQRVIAILMQQAQSVATPRKRRNAAYGCK